MSDFDREAEREKLRKKYERDKQKREASERMSELLLQGATMTNRHCPECHSPVFRYDGRQFCPTCEKEVTEEGEAPNPDQSGESEHITETVDSDGAKPHASESAEDTNRTGHTESAEDETDESTAENAPAPVGERQPARIDPPVTREDSGSDQRDTTGETQHGSGYRADSNESLRRAEESLKREIEALTQQTEETRDIGRKRELLKTAREAAETLESLYRL